MNNNATFDTGDYLYVLDYTPSTPSESIDWTISIITEQIGMILQHLLMDICWIPQMM